MTLEDTLQMMNDDPPCRIPHCSLITAVSGQYKERSINSRERLSPVSVQQSNGHLLPCEFQRDSNVCLGLDLNSYKLPEFITQMFMGKKKENQVYLCWRCSKLDVPSGSQAPIPTVSKHIKCVLLPVSRGVLLVWSWPGVWIEQFCWWFPVCPVFPLQ